MCWVSSVSSGVCWLCCRCCCCLCLRLCVLSFSCLCWVWPRLVGFPMFFFCQFWSFTRCFSALDFGLLLCPVSLSLSLVVSLSLFLQLSLSWRLFALLCYDDLGCPSVQCVSFCCYWYCYYCCCWDLVNYTYIRCTHTTDLCVWEKQFESIANCVFTTFQIPYRVSNTGYWSIELKLCDIVEFVEIKKKA